MDNIFDIYSAKVDNDKVTEWDSNLLFPDCYSRTNPLDYRLCWSAEVWLFQTITDYYCHKRGIQNGKDTQKHFEFCCASITLLYLLILKISCHRSFSLPK